MGQITRTDVIDLLRKENPSGHEHDFAIYADSFMSYQAAAANIAQHGDIVAHPRTGAPIENPYGAIRDKAGATLRKITLNVGNLWESPTRWLVAIADAGQVPTADQYEPVLARDAEEAAEIAAEDYDLPIVVWVKADADSLPMPTTIQDAE